MLSWWKRHTDPECRVPGPGGVPPASSCRERHGSMAESRHAGTRHAGFHLCFCSLLGVQSLGKFLSTLRFLNCNTERSLHPPPRLSVWEHASQRRQEGQPFFLLGFSLLSAWNALTSFFHFGKLSQPLETALIGFMAWWLGQPTPTRPTVWFESWT